MQLLTYTFRTNPFKNQIETHGEIFVFNKLKDSLEKLTTQITKEKPKYIVGIASTRGDSVLELKTINCFNRNKKVSRLNPTIAYNLHVPPTSSFRVNEDTSYSFCNWTLFKLAEFLESSHISSKLSFMHVNKMDINKMNKFLESNF